MGVLDRWVALAFVHVRSGVMVSVLRKLGSAAELAIGYRLLGGVSVRPPQLRVSTSERGTGEASSGQLGGLGPVGARDRRSLHTRWWTFQRTLSTPRTLALVQSDLIQQSLAMGP